MDRLLPLSLINFHLTKPYMAFWRRIIGGQMPEVSTLVIVMLLISAGAGVSPMVVDIAAGDAITPENGLLWRLERIGEMERAYLKLNATERALFWLACAEERLEEMEDCIDSPECLMALAEPTTSAYRPACPSMRRQMRKSCGNS